MSLLRESSVITDGQAADSSYPEQFLQSAMKSRVKLPQKANTAQMRLESWFSPRQSSCWEAADEMICTSWTLIELLEHTCVSN